MDLVIKNLSKAYSGKIALENVETSMKSGEIIGLLGPNGAGKTTFFYIIVGLLSPDSGEVFLDGENITDISISSRAKKGISYLPQEPSVFRKLSVKENILAALEQRKELDTSGQNEELNNLISEFGLKNVSESKALLLSGGERRRVEIARSLASNPKFLLLDEPFAGIDPIAVSELKETIKKLKEKKIGIVISDHNVRDTMQICDKVLVISEGKIIAKGSSKEVSSDKKVREVYLGENFVA